MKHASVWVLGAALVFLLSGGIAVAQHRHTGHIHGPKLHRWDAAPPDRGIKPPKNYLLGYDLSEYSNKERKEIISEAFRTDCDCGCNMTVARCLVNDQSCLRVRQMAEEIIERVTGKPYPDVKIDRSLDNGPIVGVDWEQLPKEQADELRERLGNMSCACGYGVIPCLAADPWCQASPLILARTYREVTGNELPGATPLRLSEVEVKTYDTLPGVDLSRLGDEQRAVVIERATKSPCLCGSGYTLAECRHENPGCERSIFIINGIIFRIFTGVDE